MSDFNYNLQISERLNRQCGFTVGNTFCFVIPILVMRILLCGSQVIFYYSNVYYVLVMLWSYIVLEVCWLLYGVSANCYRKSSSPTKTKRCRRKLNILSLELLNTYWVNDKTQFVNNFFSPSWSSCLDFVKFWNTYWLRWLKYVY